MNTDPELPALCLDLYNRVIKDLIAVARSKGYALAVHGSLARDIDLVAIPWTNTATPALELVQAIIESCGGFLPSDTVWPRKKPHGRLCWSIHFETFSCPYIDLAVMPLKD